MDVLSHPPSPQVRVGDEEQKKANEKGEEMAFEEALYETLFGIDGQL